MLQLKANKTIFQKELLRTQPPPCLGYFQQRASNQTNCHKSVRNGLDSQNWSKSDMIHTSTDRGNIF